MKEIWKKVKGYSSWYEVSNMGRLKTHNWKNKGITKIMRPAMDHGGYLRTMLKRIDGKTHTIKVHRIVAENFIDNPENKPQVNHINGIRNDNRVINLEWCSHSENIKHSFFTKRSSNKGTLNPSCILTEKQVKQIRDEYQPGRGNDKNSTALAKKYNVSASTIKAIISNRLWSHL